MASDIRLQADLRTRSEALGANWNEFHDEPEREPFQSRRSHPPHAGDAIVFADREGVIARWNRACETLFGFPADKALGRSLDLIVPVHLRDAHWRGFRAATHSGATRLAGLPTVTRAARKSGEKLYVEMTFAVVKDGESGAAVGAVAVARHVTKRVEEERRRKGRASA